MNHNRLIFTIIASAVLISIFVVYGQKLNTVPNNKVADEKIVVQVPEDWVTFTHDLSGIQIWSPANYTVEESGNLSFLLLDKSNQELTGNTSFLYFSYVPDLNSITPGEIYNTDKDAISKLTDLDVNNSIALTEDDTLAQWFTYRRDADVTIGGKIFKKYINDKPWEFPEGTSEIRYIYTEKSKVIMLGAYIHKDKLTTELMNAIVDTVMFNSAEQEALPIEEIDYTGGLDWIIFDDKTYGLKIEYPSAWIVTPAPSEGFGGLVRLSGEFNDEKVYIELSKHINLTKSEGQSLRDVELSRSPQTTIVEERMLKLNGRDVYQQKVEMMAGGANSKKYGVYNLFEIDGDLYFAELYTDKPFDQESIVENIIALISK